MNTEDIVARLDRIELLLEALASNEPQKDFYSTSELAKILNRAEFTVREWCRLGRVVAEKRACGRGISKEWIVSAEELNRIRNEGLLP